MMRAMYSPSRTAYLIGDFFSSPHAVAMSENENAAAARTIAALVVNEAVANGEKATLRMLSAHSAVLMSTKFSIRNPELSSSLVT